MNIKIEKSNKPIFYLILLIIFILFIVLFPIWPLSVKLGVLYFLISCIIFLIAFLVLTIIIALVGILFGYDIYIMPNIDEAKMSWKDRFFNPFIAIDSREDPCWFKIVRIILIISIIGICILKDYILFTGDSKGIIREWKIEGDNLILISQKENTHNLKKVYVKVSADVTIKNTSSKIAHFYFLDGIGQ